MIHDNDQTKQKDPSTFEIFLGVFNDNKFSWFSVSRHKTLEEGYKEFKKYVNKQLQYSDEELKKVWNTGRLDIELKNGNKTLNWVAIYCRETKKLTEKEKETLETKAKTVEEVEAEKASAEKEPGKDKPSAEKK